MKKYLIWVVLLAFLASGAMAIDKTKSKSEDLQSSEKKADIKLPDREKPSSAGQKDDSRKSAPRDYNDFVDHNNNGIDDRVERRKKAAEINDSKENEKSRTATEKKTEADSMKRTKSR